MIASRSQAIHREYDARFTTLQTTGGIGSSNSDCNKTSTDMEFLFLFVVTSITTPIYRSCNGYEAVFSSLAGKDIFNTRT